jgi:hypothetical protein
MHSTLLLEPQKRNLKPHVLGGLASLWDTAISSWSSEGPDGSGTQGAWQSSLENEASQGGKAILEF